MFQEESNTAEIIGKRIGFFFGYFMFTTVLFFILYFLNKLGSWGYLHVMALTLSIITIGAITKWWLK